MGAKTVGTTVSKPSKWHCHCLMDNGKEVFIAIKAHTAAEASDKVHRMYTPVEYVLDVLTHAEMERQKRHLKPSLLGTVSNY